MSSYLRTNKETLLLCNEDVRKYVVVIILLLLQFQFGGLLQAQTVQKGLVQEYNEKAKKTPLGGVELNVRSAGSTVTDKKGNFSLNFLTLKPGEKVNVRRIEKLGYEVFNKEAIEQWNLNPRNPFVIIMCRSDKFKRIRDNYERVSSASYARQLKKDEAAILKLKNDGKLKEVEYKNQLFELRESYENQLDNLENYIDKFSRIDLSELSQIEQEIIALVQQGNFEEAIRKYEDQNYLDKYRREVDDLKEVSSAIDQLYNVKQVKEQTRDSIVASINRQVETLKLAGGKENYHKIAVLLHDVAYCDTSDYRNMYNYGSFMETQNVHIEAISALKSSYNNCTDSDFRIKILVALSESYNSVSDFKSSEVLIENALNKADKFNDNELTWLYYELGVTKYKQTMFDEAEALFFKAMETCHNSSGTVEGQTYYVLSSLYRTRKRFEEALVYAQKCLNYFEMLQSESKSNKYFERILQCFHNIASIYYYSGNNQKAEEYRKKLLNEYESLYIENPQKYASAYAWHIVMYSKLLSKQENYDKELKQLDIALPILDSLYTEYPTAYGKEYVQALEEYGICLIRINRVNLSESYFNKASSIAGYLYECDDVAFRPLYLMNQYRNAFRYYSNKDFIKAIEYNTRALALIEPLYQKDDRTYGDLYTSILEFIGLSYDGLGNYDLALDYIDSCLGIRKKLYLEKKGISKASLAQAYRNLGQVYSNKEDWDSAINNYSVAYDTYYSLIPVKPSYDKYAVAMQRNIAAIYSDVFSDFEKAHTAIDKALVIFPNDISILEQKGELFLLQNEVSKATNILNLILSISPTYDTDNSSFVKNLKRANETI